MAQEFESTQIPGGGENVFSWDRSQIEDAFGHLDTTDANAQGKKYADSASEFDQALDTFKRSVSASIAEAWEGASAESAKKAIKQYTDDAATLTDLFANVSVDIKAAADAVVKTKSSIPAAARHSWTANIWPPRAREEEKSRANADSEARDVMNQHYVQPFSEFDRTVPVVPPSLNPLNPSGASGPSNPGTSGPNGPGNSGPNGPNGPGASGPHGPAASGSGTAGASGPGSQQQSGDQTTSSHSPTSMSSAQDTKTSSYDPNSTATTPSGLSPDSPYGSTGGDTSGLNNSQGATTNSPGRSVPGTPGGTSSSAQTAAAARTTGTAAGGMSGMGTAGRGKGESDSEKDHETPDYLINEENARELIGEIERTVPGGVIGGDYNTRNTPSED